LLFAKCWIFFGLPGPLAQDEVELNGHWLLAPKRCRRYQRRQRFPSVRRIRR